MYIKDIAKKIQIYKYCERVEYTKTMYKNVI